MDFSFLLVRLFEKQEQLDDVLEYEQFIDVGDLMNIMLVIVILIFQVFIIS